MLTTDTKTLRGRVKGMRLRALRADWLRKRIKDQKNRCGICGSLMAPPKGPHMPGSQPTLDHIKPLSKGGLDHWENTQAAHSKCNQAKGAVYDAAE